MSSTNTYDSTTAETETYAQKSKEDGTYQFRYDGDRRYHGFKDSIYYLPHDEREHVRLDQLHAFMKKFWGSNIFAPIVSEPSLIMDVGAGRGGWVIDVAKQYPRANVIGFDLSPIIRHEKPENAEFVVGDLHVDLKRFIDGTIDLIHSRMLCGGVKADEWDRYIKKVFELLKPGTGWAQFVEDSYKTWDGDAVPEASPFYKVVYHSDTSLVGGI
jgi:Methyltransferase domain